MRTIITMKKSARKGIYLDYLHKGFVCTCLAATLYAGSYLAFRGYRYIMEVRPENKKVQDAENKKLLTEGSSDYLTDTSPSLKM